MSESEEKRDISMQVANYNYNMAEAQSKLSGQNREKYEEFKERIAQFAKVDTIEEAKSLSAKILPVSQEINQFKVGLGTCTIINRSDLFRISLDSEEEFISYDFS